MFDLKEFRRANGITQAELARYLDVSEPFISQVETGKAKLPQDKLEMLLNNDMGWDDKPFRVNRITVPVRPTNTGANNKSFEQVEIRILKDRVMALERLVDALEKQNAEYWEMIKKLTDK